MKQRVWVAIAAVGAAGALGVGWLLGDRHRWPLATDCPAGLRTDPDRASAIVHRLGSTSRGRQLLDQLTEPLTVCFDHIDLGVLRTDGAFVLPAHWQDGENAARLGHLLLHQIEGPPLPEPIPEDTGCQPLVAHAMQAEVRAHQLEVQLRRELGVTGTREVLGFEPEYWEVAPEQRSSLVAAFLAAPGRRPSLKQGYEARCRQSQEAARTHDR